MLVLDERVEDSWHDEVCDSTTCVTPSTGQRVGSSDDILVKETSRPNLARHEGTTEDTNEESDGVETGSAANCSSESRRNSTEE